MNTVLLDFNTRANEVNDYFIFLEGLIEQTTKLAVTDSAGNDKIQSLNPELAKTLKANGFLLLYNLVESTMRNAIEAIFDEFKNQAISFDQLKPEIKMIVLQNLKKRSLEEIHLQINQISTDIIIATFDSKKLFSGNVDAKLIKEIAQKYGFSCQTEPTQTKNGQNLVVIKRNRNDLAHGVKSFKEVGQGKTIEDLLKIKDEVIEYLRQILENIKTYLDNQEYLDVTTGNP
ncbi:MAG: MAE_28990/MAE_18760 family HEPN-like nuclease [Microcoleus sp.]|uniref:MAE_28990/MAE_18760 family HEPN-like nuclease n=1 Tax=unclassified Microcoleus TaxID=2642155 RepID=UPI002FD52E2F